MSKPIVPDVSMADFTYQLPDDRIAKYALADRDQSKLLVYKKGQIEHVIFNQLGAVLPPDSLLVFNDTRVIAARLYFTTETGASIEILLLSPAAGEELNLSLQHTDSAFWTCMIGNRKKWRVGDTLVKRLDLGDNTITLKVSLPDYGKNEVLLNWSGGMSLAELLDGIGTLPLPPYLHREAIEADKKSYQTVYASNLGAVAAPTAGLHFTEPLLQQLARGGHEQMFVTLHVGAGTFLPVKVAKAAEHPMHAETFIIDKSLIESLYLAGRAVIAVGTTTTRTLESLYWVGVQILEEGSFNRTIDQLIPYQNHIDYSLKDSLKAILEWMDANGFTQLKADTSIMIMPGYNFKVIKALITNFHQPNSTLLLLISAFIGDDWKQIYSKALKNDYRFLSFGDSSLLMP